MLQEREKKNTKYNIQRIIITVSTFHGFNVAHFHTDAFNTPYFRTNSFDTPYFYTHGFTAQLASYLTGDGLFFDTHRQLVANT